MNPHSASSPRIYPDPAPGDAEGPEGSAFFPTRRSQQPSLSHEDENLANSLAHDMNGHITTLPPPMGDGQTGGLASAGQSSMPPTPHRSSTDAPLAGQHAGMDPNQDLTYTIGNESRKRMKVSRACDECRRKKIRCDSNASEGCVIDTCSNCKRLKLTCQFERAPRKRGPSKGYIRDLAERVHLVESQMNMPSHGRPSLDAASPPESYPEPPYSPSEPLSGGRKRPFSQFDGRNPFQTTPRGSRDRIDSIGGDILSQGPLSERPSVSIAPDEQVTTNSPSFQPMPTRLAKPFWAQETDVERPGSRQTVEPAGLGGSLWPGDSLFEVYIATVHEDVSILPASFNTVQHHVSRCPPPLASAFSHVLAHVTGFRVPGGPLHPEAADLDRYIWLTARTPPARRNVSENLVWLWLYAFMIFHIDSDVARQGSRTTSLPKSILLKLALDLSDALLESFKPTQGKEPVASIEAPHNTILRTSSCILIFAQLQAIGIGKEDQAGLSICKGPVSRPEAKQLLSPSTACLAAFSQITSILSSHMTASADRPSDSLANIKTRRMIESLVDTITATFASTATLGPLLSEWRLFIALLLSRLTFTNDPAEIFKRTSQLVEALTTERVNPQNSRPVATRPLDMHTYTLSGLTLLELIDSGDADLVRHSKAALAGLHYSLEQIAERTHQRLRGIPREEAETGVGIQLHWSDALLRLIDAKKRVEERRRTSQAPRNASDATIESTTADSALETSNSDADAEKDAQVITNEQAYLISRLTQAATVRNTLHLPTTAMVVVDFSLLMRKGYMNILTDMNGY